ncbi:MAG: L-2-amino-thiazoline-4-carboxylic acid hydrolase [Proteobacteria bacterium]|nr:L-2-amino-thiazoline-4-carboxylic acid hydrolase [Pseudomonadota bacterium]
MAEQSHGRYYLDRKPHLMAQFDLATGYFSTALPPFLETFEISHLLDQARTEFEDILPELPYIGGESNMLTKSLIQGAQCLPIFEALEAKGLEIRELARLVYEWTEREIEAKSEEKKRNVRGFYFSPGMRAVEMNRAAESQSGRFPEDWVSEFVDGDGRGFDFGIDFVECGLCKFFGRRGAERYTPIFCLSDYATYRAFKIGFRRTRTLAAGAAACDFRFNQDWTTPRGWPPESLEEYLPF